MRKDSADNLFAKYEPTQLIQSGKRLKEQARNLHRFPGRLGTRSDLGEAACTEWG